MPAVTDIALRQINPLRLVGRTSTLALFPPDLKYTSVFCVEHKAAPVQLWGEEMEWDRDAGGEGSRIKGKETGQGRAGEGLWHPPVCPAMGLFDL